MVNTNTINKISINMVTTIHHDTAQCVANRTLISNMLDVVFTINCLGSYIENFKEEQIDINIFLLMDEHDLVDMNVNVDDIIIMKKIIETA
jgi:hypothetical protein